MRHGCKRVPGVADNRGVHGLRLRVADQHFPSSAGDRGERGRRLRAVGSCNVCSCRRLPTSAGDRDWHGRRHRVTVGCDERGCQHRVVRVSVVLRSGE